MAQMKNVAMLSAFRNTQPANIERYFKQASAYRNALKERGWGFRLRVVEGDSTNDDVWRNVIKTAAKYDLTCYLHDASHGGPVFGSVVSEERFKALSKVGNTMLGLVQPDDDIVVYIESDLIWNPETLLRLGSLVLDTHLDILSPLIMAGNDFYDVWAFRGLDGANFAPFKPYHSCLNEYSYLTEVQSVGSCLVMRGEVARECRIVDDECLVGFCRDARNKGYRVWVDPYSKVYHP
jgi:hypothetical protein